MSAPVRVAIDFKHPAAYLAVAPARALEARLGRTFEWLPLDVPPLQEHVESAAEDRGARHRRIRNEYLVNDLRRYADSRGLELGDPHRRIDTTIPSLGLLWLRSRAPALASDYVARVFDRIWAANAAADLEFVERSLGGEAAGFRAYAASEGPKELAAVREELLGRGAWNVPAFYVAGEIFLGRQHLPMIEWLCTGQTGPAPI